MNTPQHIAYSVLCFLVAFAGPACAQVYKWTDANGKTQYSDKAPDDKKSKTAEVKIAPALPRSAASAPRISDATRETPKNRVFESPPEEPSAPRPSSTESSQCQGARAMVQAIKEKRAFRSPRGVAGEKDKVPVDEHELKLFENDVKQYCR